jgi:hypothetical protein
VRHRLRRALAELTSQVRAETTIRVGRAREFFATLCLTATFAVPFAASASTSVASAGSTSASGVSDEKAQEILKHFHPRTPTATEHTEFVVEVNRKGQVTRVRKGLSSSNASFNSMTYGNALQAFIRTPDGNAISGLYKLSYDYDPKTKLVKRDVALIHPGGVDPNALGAVLQMQQIAQKRAAETKALPDLDPDVTKHRHPRR